jgi:hypothetical protein
LASFRYTSARRSWSSDASDLRSVIRCSRYPRYAGGDCFSRKVTIRSVGRASTSGSSAVKIFDQRRNSDSHRITHLKADRGVFRQNPFRVLQDEVQKAWTKLLQVPDSGRVAVQLVVLFLCETAVSSLHLHSRSAYSCNMANALSCIFLP